MLFFLFLLQLKSLPQNIHLVYGLLKKLLQLHQYLYYQGLLNSLFFQDFQPFCSSLLLSKKALLSRFHLQHCQVFFHSPQKEYILLSHNLFLILLTEILIMHHFHFADLKKKNHLLVFVWHLRYPPLYLH